MKTAICKITIDDGHDVRNLPDLIEGNVHRIHRCVILDQPDVDEQIYQATKRNIERMSREQITNSGMWILSKIGNGMFSASTTEKNKLCHPERRIYFSREAIERDFGKIDFCSQVDTPNY